MCSVFADLLQLGYEWRDVIVLKLKFKFTWQVSQIFIVFSLPFLLLHLTFLHCELITSVCARADTEVQLHTHIKLCITTLNVWECVCFWGGGGPTCLHKALQYNCYDVN